VLREIDFLSKSICWLIQLRRPVHFTLGISDFDTKQKKHCLVLEFTFLTLTLICLFLDNLELLQKLTTAFFRETNPSFFQNQDRLYFPTM